MSQTVNRLQQSILRHVDITFIALFFLIVACVVTYGVTRQNVIARNIEQKIKLTEQSFSVPVELTPLITRELLAINDIPHNNVTAFAHTGSVLLTRKITISDDQVELVFIHPLIVLLSSIYSWLFCFSYGVLAFLSRKKVQRLLQDGLSGTQQLENWAQSAKINGKAQPVNDESNVANMINKLQKDLYHAENKEGHIDQLIRERALLDNETGVGNREFFTNRLEAFLHEEEVRGAVILIQCKEGDVIQSLYGRQYVIDVLDEVIQICRKRLQHLPSFFIARRSDFELALLLPNLYVNEAEKLANRLLKNLIRLTLPIGVNPEEFIHLGISCFKGGQKSYQVMAEADMALRSAQLQGPSQWFMFEKGEFDKEYAKGSLRWRTFLLRAIERNAFVLFFQPVVSSENNEILHHEVLSKVKDSHGDLITASVFLPMAQKCGLTPQIDLLVFDQVCRLLQYENKEQDVCSLNLSIDSLLSKSFRHELLNEMDENVAVVSRLIIEISEYHLVAHLAELSPFLTALSDRGVKILADKVGQYVINASYLKSCPISFIKLHRSIVLKIHKKSENQVFIQSLKAICDQQKVKIYALGVESIEEWQALIRLGIDGGQGHFFTEPVAKVAHAIVMGK